MKRFLLLFIFTSFLFGQDILLHKSGVDYQGTYIGKVDGDIVFQIEGRPSTNKFPINDVDIIMTSYGDLYYPFDMPIKKESSSFGKGVLYLKSGEFHKGVFIPQPLDHGCLRHS